MFYVQRGSLLMQVCRFWHGFMGADLPVRSHLRSFTNGKLNLLKGGGASAYNGSMIVAQSVSRVCSYNSTDAFHGFLGDSNYICQLQLSTWSVRISPRLRSGCTKCSESGIERSNCSFRMDSTQYWCFRWR